MDKQSPLLTTVFSDAALKLKNPYQEHKLRLKAPIHQNGTKVPTFSVDIKENNPVLKVRTGIDGDKNFGVIEGPTTTPGFYTMLEYILEVANTPEPTSLLMVLMGHPFNGKERSKEKRPVATFKVEKNAEGIIVLYLTAGDSRPVIGFPLLLDDYHSMRNAQNQPMSKELASKLAARAYVAYNKEWMANALNTYVEPEWMKKRQAAQSAEPIKPVTGGSDYEYDLIL